ncbi:MAG TPA: bifunctional ADP-heptose synthase [Longimicrobiales bacterium]|nr:bifunctional ADP-heptose synthase [Longimicrobiales bacterium]
MSPAPARPDPGPRPGPALGAADPERAAELLERARGVRVLVVGDLMLDRYVSGRVERVSPEAPVPVVRVEAERWGVGGAGNVAANATALGADCAVVGHVGADAEGELLLEALAARGVDTGGVVREGPRPTTVKTRVLAKHQQIVRFDRESEEDARPPLAAALVAAVAARAPGCDVLVVQDYDKGVLAPPVVAEILRRSSEMRVPCVVDPKRRRFFGYAGATVFKPNERELADALGEPVRASDAAWMEAIRARLGCANLLLTLGEQGMALQRADGVLRGLPAAARAVYDVSGAGDTVTAAVAVALAAGATVDEAAQLANHAAALEVAKPGVQTVSAQEILDDLRARAGEAAPTAGPAHS